MRVVLDASSADRAVLGGVAQHLSRLSNEPEVVVGVEAAAGDLLVTDLSDHAAAAVARGARAWQVSAGTGELERWEDLPLAMAFAGGTLSDVEQSLAGRAELGGESIATLSWTPQGDVSGTTNRGTPVFATAGPDGETPQVFIGATARSREAAAASFAQTLTANAQVARSGELTSGQTHSLTDHGSRRPVLKRQRFTLVDPPPLT